jgi:hypothetical protein
MRLYRNRRSFDQPFLEEKRTMDRFRTILAATLLGVTLAMPGVIDVPAFAMSGSSSTATPPSCRAGWEWNKAKRMCERKGSRLFDGERQEQDRTLALFGNRARAAQGDA